MCAFSCSCARVGAAVGVHGDAAAGGEQDRLAADDEGRGEDLVDALHQALEVLTRVDARQQQHEVVDADVRHHVVGAHVLVQALADGAQELVAGLLTEGVVDVLEAVEVEPHEGELTLPALGAGERSRERHREHRPVGQSGDRVDEGETLCPRLRALLLGGVLDDDDASSGRSSSSLIGTHWARSQSSPSGRAGEPGPS